MDGLRQELESRDSPDSAWVKRLLVQLQDKLIATQELADEKLHSVQQILDLIERKQEQLDFSSKSLDAEKSENEKAAEAAANASNSRDRGAADSSGSERASKRPRRTPRLDSTFSYSNSLNSTVTASASPLAHSAASSMAASASAGVAATAPAAMGSGPLGITSGGGGSGSSYGSSQHDTSQDKTPQRNVSSKVASQKKAAKKKKRKSRLEREREDSPTELPIDPDEPTYCLCEQVSYGEMIGCDNDLCPIEWFHFSCVNLTHKPKGKWFCPKCRGDKPTMMKPRAQFLRELEKYNKEKEEKS
ncbi:hypothetical protein HAZT_HAZT002227 [Hyalella azteca]|nr:hypothetical protein HAZT_HAZT002227 [Hyalella azteca]